MPSILYVGELDYGGTSRDKAEALASIGATVDMIGPSRPAGLAGKLDFRLSRTLYISPSISRLNSEIISRFNERSYDILFLEKAWMVRPETVQAVRSQVATIVYLNNDNPWGDIERGMWRLVKRYIPLVDEVMVPKYSVVRYYERKGAKRVSVVDFGFAPARHFCPAGIPEKVHDLCFVGVPHKDGGGIRPHRSRLILDLARALPGRVSVFGPGWGRTLKGVEKYFKVISEGVWGDEYRETIWASKVNLSFITKGNWEESSHRTFEIAACGGCLLAERSSRLEQTFCEGEEALFFSDTEEAVALATRLLEDAALRKRLSHAATRRAVESGYDNASRFTEAIVRSPILKKHFPRLAGLPDASIAST
jgi:spore maturation protein CgeB